MPHTCVPRWGWAALRAVHDASPLALSCSRKAAARAGLADAVYAEAYVTVHQYDIVLDVTVINRTSDTLQNLCLELATMGDLKLVERPQNYTLGPGATRTVRCALPSPESGFRLYSLP